MTTRKGILLIGIVSSPLFPSSPFSFCSCSTFFISSVEFLGSLHLSHALTNLGITTQHSLEHDSYTTQVFTIIADVSSSYEEAESDDVPQQQHLSSPGMPFSTLNFDLYNN
jgi:hypothetical protein